jgi:hypothetical protein
MFLLLLFVPVFVVVLAFRDWRRYRDGIWPPPLGLVASLGVVLTLLAAIWWSVTLP